MHDDFERWAVAIHEAGHAVIPRTLGLRCRGAKIIRTSDVGLVGTAETYSTAETLAEWAACPRRRHRNPEVAHRAMVMACMAGEEAELAILGRCPRRGGDGDRRSVGVVLIIYLRTPSLKVMILEHRLRCFTRQLVKRHQVVIVRVAEALVKRGTLTGEDIDALVASFRDESALFMR